MIVHSKKHFCLTSLLKKTTVCSLYICYEGSVQITTMEYQVVDIKVNDHNSEMVVVPTSWWSTDGKQSVLWPPYTGQKLWKAAKVGEKPCANWKVYPVTNSRYATGMYSAELQLSFDFNLRL